MTRTALITGASSGIGLEFARLLAKDKFDLVIIARSKEKLKSIKDELQGAHGVDVMAIVMDLTRHDAAKKVYAELKKQGKQVDVLINNAGFGLFGSFVDTDLSKEANMVDLNCLTMMKFSKLYAKDMVARNRGKILNVASIAGFYPGPKMAVYFATKAFVLHFTEALAEELKDSRVTVTCLCPGPTETPFIESANQEESGIIKGRSLPTARDVAEFGYYALLKGRRLAVFGFKNRLLVFLSRFLPRKTVARLVGNSMAKN